MTPLDFSTKLNSVILHLIMPDCLTKRIPDPAQLEDTVPRDERAGGKRRMVGRGVGEGVIT